jgi:hypothetical protein
MTTLFKRIGGKGHVPKFTCKFAGGLEFSARREFWPPGTLISITT